MRRFIKTHDKRNQLILNSLLVSIVMSLFLLDEVEIGTILTKFTGLEEGNIVDNFRMSLTSSFIVAFFVCYISLI